MKRAVNTKEYTSWRVNQIILTEASFKEIMDLIEDTYGCKVVVDESMQDIENITFTATIPSTELDVLLKILSESYNVHFSKEENTIRIFKKEP